MNNPLISVLMITYNHESFIAKAIESVLMQETNYSFELIIGEDCSTDNTHKIVLDYAQRYPDCIKVVTSEKNVGFVKNAYRTFLECRGKYIAFCEGDDYWNNSTKLQKQIDYLEKHSECGLICSDYDIYYTDTGKRIERVNHNSKRDPITLRNILYTLRGTSGIQTCTVVVRSDIYKKVLDSDPVFFQDPLQPCMDRPLWIGILMKSELAYIDESLATYNRLVHSATSRKNPSELLNISIRMKEQILYLIDKYNLSSEEKNTHVNDLWKRKLKLSFYESNIEMADECKDNLKKMSFIEYILYFGARYRLLNFLFSHFLNHFFRVIPPSNYNKVLD
ncbi:hypothetical protein DSCO28_18780 [Desulfosarcina ovata subsp. sediminis]|uniref:Glycosyltransferase 2-like domain-containing protein n=1 Tax=Desulfosarcina ovata subsp. sediminis TaxID=885957 RepID=A0A5K7ZGT4_9BACT|nr:glycosyltransferase [Desulfosarcina ovata]BBO81312.1 hypothetical protein DSCO28_18780 [Desulfosarcina ovata subsp. sediminis]